MEDKRQALIAKAGDIESRCAKLFKEEHGITLSEWEEQHSQPNVVALVEAANKILPDNPEAELEHARQLRLARMRGIRQSQDGHEPEDLTGASFPTIWRAMGELDIDCLGLPFSCGFLQDQLERLVGLARVVKDYDAMRASYKSFCQQEVKRNGQFTGKIKRAQALPVLDPWVGYKPERKSRTILERMLEKKDSSDSEEEKKDEESASSESEEEAEEDQEEESEEEDIELVAMQLRSQWQVLSNKLADFHGPSPARALLRERCARASERLAGVALQLPYLKPDESLQKWVCCGKPGLKYVDLASSFSSKKLLDFPEKISWCLGQEDLPQEERERLEGRMSEMLDKYDVSTSVATCTITRDDEFVRPSFAYSGHLADPYIEEKQSLPICAAAKDRVLFNLWVDPKVDYKNPGVILRCAMGMNPASYEQKVLFEWAAGVSRHWKKWLEEPIPRACRACGQPCEGCVCDCDCEHRTHTCFD